MDTRKLVKTSNIIGLVSVVLLAYWVFAFVLIQVFGLKIFREYITEIFGMSIFGIIALMAGALMLNIMLNLTRIAERGQEVPIKSGKKMLYAVLMVFPLLAALLFGGNYLTIKKKEQILIHSAQKLILHYPAQTAALTAYRFDLPYLKNTADHLDLLEKQDTAFRSVEIIVPDTINGTPVYLRFGSRFADSTEVVTEETVGSKAQDTIAYQSADKKHKVIKKADYIYRGGLREREYLQNVFTNNLSETRFESGDGNYALFYPYRQDGKTVAVFRLSDYQQYGKFGS